MQEGDKFYLHVMDEVLAYQVDQVKVVEPEHTEDLEIIPGGDYCTLVTCTPYAINTHRMLVRGVRVPYNGEDEDADTPAGRAVPGIEHRQHRQARGGRLAVDQRDRQYYHRRRGTAAALLLHRCKKREEED